MGGAAPRPPPTLTSGPYYMKKWPLIEPVRLCGYSTIAKNLHILPLLSLP